MLHLLLLAAVPEAGAASAPPAPIHNFLKGAEARRCAPTAANREIVVCGGQGGQEEFRLRPPPDAARYAERPVRAEANVLGDATLGMHGEHATVGGFPGSRAMVTLALPF